MAWTDLSGAFGYGTKLTSAQMQNLRDNITALANGDAGAPDIAGTALGVNIGTTRQTYTSATVSHWEVLGWDGAWHQTSPNFDEGGGGTCFPAGSMVLMADMSWRPVEKVSTGDMVFCHHGSAKVREAYRTKLGNRLMYRMRDNSLLFSEEHAFFVNRPEGSYLWTMSKSQLKKEMSEGLIGGLKDFEQIYEGSALVEERFAFVNWELKKGWKISAPVVIPDYNLSKDLPLYLPLTENGELIIVNGYLVGASIDEFKCDYRKIKWQDGE
jgi:hypothetical protein